MHRSLRGFTLLHLFLHLFCFGVFNRFSSYSCLLFSGEFAQKKKSVSEDNYHKPGGKKIAFYSASSEGKIPLAKTNKSQKNAKPTLLSGFRCLECIFKKSSANSKVRQMSLLLQTLLSSDVSLDPAPNSCWVGL